jgi:hypothetical protein
MTSMIPGLRRAVYLYVGVTWAYGVAHAIPFLWSRKTKYVLSKERQDMLLVDKVLHGAQLGCSSLFLWPFLLREDLIRLECLMRGKRASDFLWDDFPWNDE